MFPLGVVGRHKFIPKATYAIIAINVLVFIWELSVQGQGMEFLEAALQKYGLEVCKIGIQPTTETIFDTFRSMFLHGSLGHLLGNMWFLFIFGGMVEKYLGSLKFAIAYIVFGYLATLAHVIFGNTTCSTVDTGVVIGASGAIAGVMGGFLYLHPGAKVRTMIGLFRPFVWTLKLPAFLFLGYWLVMDILQHFGWIGVETNVAHWAHIGGFIVGFAILFVTGFFKPVPTPDPLEHLFD